VAHGNHAFNVIDTPGNNPLREVVHHALLLRKALTLMPLCGIFVVVKFDARAD
jgi:hypothetical protein